MKPITLNWWGTPSSQAFTLSGYAPHRTREGAVVTLAVWLSKCPVCGEPFTVMTPEAVVSHKRFTHRVHRYCEKHKHGGRKGADKSSEIAFDVFD